MQQIINYGCDTEFKTFSNNLRAYSKPQFTYPNQFGNTQGYIVLYLCYAKVF